MAGHGGYRSLLLFLGGYLLLSVPPFLYLNREVLDAVRAGLSPTDPLAVVWVAVALSVLLGLLRAGEGVERYTLFFTVPGNLFAVLVLLSYVFAAVAWWAVPELVFHLEVDVTLNQLLLLVLACQVPMVVFLSLMTALGRALSP